MCLISTSLHLLLLRGLLPPTVGLCATRAMVGLGEGIAPSAATDMVARVIAKVPPPPLSYTQYLHVSALYATNSAKQR